MSMPMSVNGRLRRVPSAGEAARGAPLQIDLHGLPAAIRADGSRIALSGKAAALLALALMEPDISRRSVALMLWPDSAESLARNNLRTLVHRLARQLGCELIQPGDTLRIVAEAAQLRTLQADDLLAAVQAGGTARCHLLDGVELTELDDFQAWLASARQRATQRQLAVLSSAHAQARHQPDPARTIALARACVLLEPMGERWHRQLMETLADCGDRAAALAAYEDCRTALRDNLGASPDDRTRSLHVRILQGGGDLRGSQQPGAHGVALVEREQPLQQMQAALGRGQHVALQGEAGIGKTRVLHEVCVDARFLYVQLRVDARHDPFAAVAQVLQAAQQRHRLRFDPSARVELARIAPHVFPEVVPSNAPLSMPRLLDAFQKWADALRGAGVEVLAVDDVQCAHPTSQAVFAALVATRESAQAPLTVIFSHRSGEIDAALVEAITAAQIQRRLHGLTLHRLSPQGIEALLLALGHGRNEVRASAAELYRSTAGNPLFVIELTLFSQQERVDDRFGAVGTNLEVLMQTRLALCSEPARRLAYVAGLALDDFSVELAAAVTESSAFDLMPAWAELQLRGLFSERGLAHDLVRDAVMASLPVAIRGAIHRRIAEQLERHGVVGPTVLRHWLAVGDMERAYVHAEFDLNRVTGTGQSGLEQELVLFDVIDRMEGAAQLQRLWATAPLRLWLMPQAALERLDQLIRRVELVARSDDARAWVAFERARLLQLRTADQREAYAILSAAASSFHLDPVARAWMEVWLCDFADKSGMAPYNHARQAVEAAAPLPRTPQHESLFRTLATVRMEYLLDHLSLVREEAARLRTARRQADAGSAQDAHEILANGFYGAGLLYAAARHYKRARSVLAPGALGEWRRIHGARAGCSALLDGQFTEAIACFEAMIEAGNSQASFFHVYTAWAWYELGCFDQAQACADAAASPELDAAYSITGFHARVVSRIARARGEDGTAPLRRAVAQLSQLGAPPVQADLVQLALVELTGTPQERVAVAEALLQRVMPPYHYPGHRMPTMLALAEALHDAGDDRCRDMALQGASLARRGHTTRLSYPPEMLTRFAAVLERTDPAVAASLTQVARRWIIRAMPHVPEAARGPFVRRVAVNRRLLLR